jgi:hypothetical protein
MEMLSTGKIIFPCAKLPLGWFLTGREGNSGTPAACICSLGCSGRVLLKGFTPAHVFIAIDQVQESHHERLSRRYTITKKAKTKEDNTFTSLSSPKVRKLPGKISASGFEELFIPEPSTKKFPPSIEQ